MIKDVIAGAGRNWSFLLLLSKYFMDSHGSEHTGFSVVRCLWSSVCQSASWCEHIASVPQYRCLCNAGVCTLYWALLYSWAVSSQPAYQRSPLRIIPALWRPVSHRSPWGFMKNTQVLLPVAIDRLLCSMWSTYTELGSLGERTLVSVGVLGEGCISGSEENYQ